MNNMQQFKETINAFSQDFNQIKEKHDELLGLRDEFTARVEKIKLGNSLFGRKTPLTAISNEYSNQLKLVQSSWAQHWQLTQEMRELSDHFQDKIVLLVYGKVNAGKSSLCNFIANQFKTAEYFYLENGQIQFTKDPFAEGSTETTSRIQGVKLDNNLILLDTPGLHSITDKNHELTKRFTDSADGVLWVTPSVSPGQTEELDSLTAEISKPLLPVISRSDCNEEDVDEAGNLISILANKSAEVRQLQEQDVQNRTEEKLGKSASIEQPVSVSVHCFKESDKSLKSLEDSGLNNFFSRLQKLAHEAKAYKPQKARQQIINYLEKTVFAGIKNNLEPMLASMQQQTQNEMDALAKNTYSLTQKLQGELMARVADWAEELKESKDKKELENRIQNYISTEIAQDLKNSMDRFNTQAKQLVTQYDLGEFANFEDITVEIKQQSGGVGRAAAGVAGMALGAALVALSGGAGIVLYSGASILGGFLGERVGNAFVEETIHSEVVGVDVSVLVASLNEKISQKLPDIVKNSFSAWGEALEAIQENCQKIEQEVQRFNQKIIQAKQGV
ncbi:MAG: GTPase [Venatoribacter sp.]